MTDSILAHPEDWEELYRAATAAPSKIEAMRIVRDASRRLGHTMTLKECKAYVDQLEIDNRPGRRQINQALELLKQARRELELSGDLLPEGELIAIIAALSVVTP